MDIDRLEEILKLANQFPVVVSTDANAFFYQFPLSDRAAKRFPLQIGTGRGAFQKFCLTALPMGFKYAPAIAQRTSNMVIRRVKKFMAEQHLQGAVTAWIDNYLVFADSRQTADVIMMEMQKWLTHFEIAHKPVEYSGEFLGLISDAQGIRLTDKFVEKARAAFQSFRKAVTVDHNDFLVVFGHVMWANITVIRRPLCFAPCALRCIRRASENLDELIPTDVKLTLLEELQPWIDTLDTIMNINDPGETVKVWSDATPTTVAFVIEDGNDDIIARAEFSHPVPIFIAELIAAVWAGIMAKGRPHLLIDNTAAAYALAKGHSSNEQANVLIGTLYTRNQPATISWVSTHQQRADGPSRGEAAHARAAMEIPPLGSFFAHAQ